MVPGADGMMVDSSAGTEVVDDGRRGKRRRLIEVMGDDPSLEGTLMGIDGCGVDLGKI